MNRFLWLVRREVAEHRAIWIAPAIVIGCLFLLLMLARAHLGFDVNASFADVPRDGQIRLHMLAYAMVTAIIFLVMGTVGFFYCIDALYADRADRSVLFWKSLPLSDAETVLSKFATAAVLIPLVATAGAVIAHLAIGGGLMAKFALSGHYPGLWLHPHAIAGGAAMALATCVVAVLWYAPVVSYLMLASAWAPRAPFLWAVLPPVAAAVLEAVVLRTSYVRDLVMERLFGLYAAFGERRPDGQPDRGDVNGLAELAERLGEVDWQARVLEFLRSPDLWAGVVVAALLLAAAMWVRRYRDETS